MHIKTQLYCVDKPSVMLHAQLATVMCLQTLLDYEHLILFYNIGWVDISKNRYQIPAYKYLVLPGLPGFREAMCLGI